MSPDMVPVPRCTTSPTILESFVLPKPVGAELAAVLHLMAHPHPDVPAPTAFTSKVCDQAVAALGHHSQWCEPASLDVVTAWLWPIADGVEYTPSESEFFRRANVLWLATCERMPHVAWTVRAQREGLAVWRRMPSVASVIELVEEPVLPLLRRVELLKRIVRTVDGTLPD